MVPAPPQPAQSTDTEASELQPKTENNSSEAEMPLKLPRAMRSAASNNGKLLRERNSEQTDAAAVTSKDASVVPPTSPAPKARISREKENHGH